MRYFVHREREVLQELHDQLWSHAIGVTWDGLYNGHHMGWTL